MDIGPTLSALGVVMLCSLPLVAAYALILRPRVKRWKSEAERSEARTRRLARVLGLLLILGSLVCVLAGASTIQTAIQSSAWPRTEGIVTASGYRRGSTTEGPVQFVVTIDYRYVVADQVYESDHLGWSSRFDVVSTRNQAEEFVGRFSPGTPVVVTYNPDNPAQSALNPGLGHGPVAIALGLLILAAGVYAAWWGLGRRRHEDPWPSTPSPPEGPEPGVQPGA